MAQIPEDVKNSILAARQSYATSFETLNKPILQYSGAVQRAGAQGSYLGSFGAIQQAAGQQMKAKEEVTAASGVFESAVAKQTPELGQPQLVQKEYDIAIQKINDKIKDYDSRIVDTQQRINEAVNEYKGTDRRQRISQLQDQLSLIKQEERAWKEYAGKDKPEVIRAVASGEIQNLASNYREIGRAEIESSKYQEQLQQIVKSNPNYIPTIEHGVITAIKDATIINELSGDKGGAWLNLATGDYQISSKNLSKEGYTLTATPTELASKQYYNIGKYSPNVVFGELSHPGGVSITTSTGGKITYDQPKKEYNVDTTTGKIDIDAFGKPTQFQYQIGEQTAQRINVVQLGPKDAISVQLNPDAEINKRLQSSAAEFSKIAALTQGKPDYVQSLFKYNPEYTSGITPINIPISLTSQFQIGEGGTKILPTPASPYNVQTDILSRLQSEKPIQVRMTDLNYRPELPKGERSLGEYLQIGQAFNPATTGNVLSSLNLFSNIAKSIDYPRLLESFRMTTELIQPLSLAYGVSQIPAVNKFITTSNKIMVGEPKYTGLTPGQAISSVGNFLLTEESKLFRNPFTPDQGALFKPTGYTPGQAVKDISKEVTPYLTTAAGMANQFIRTELIPTAKQFYTNIVEPGIGLTLTAEKIKSEAERKLFGATIAGVDWLGTNVIRPAEKIKTGIETAAAKQVYEKGIVPTVSFLTTVEKVKSAAETAAAKKIYENREGILTGLETAYGYTPPGLINKAAEAYVSDVGKTIKEVTPKVIGASIFASDFLTASERMAYEKAVKPAALFTYEFGIKPQVEQRVSKAKETAREVIGAVDWFGKNIAVPAAGIYYETQVVPKIEKGKQIVSDVTPYVKAAAIGSIPYIDAGVEKTTIVAGAIGGLAKDIAIGSIPYIDAGVKKTTIVAGALGESAKDLAKRYWTGGAPFQYVSPASLGILKDKAATLLSDIVTSDAYRGKAVKVKDEFGNEKLVRYVSPSTVIEFAATGGKRKEVLARPASELPQEKAEAKQRAEDIISLGEQLAPIAFYPLVAIPALEYGQKFLTTAATEGIKPAYEKNKGPLISTAITAAAPYLKLPGIGKSIGLFTGSTTPEAYAAIYNAPNVLPKLFGPIAQSYVAFGSSNIGNKISMDLINKIKSKQGAISEDLIKTMQNQPESDAIQNKFTEKYQTKVNNEFNKEYQNQIAQSKITEQKAKEEFQNSNYYKNIQKEFIDSKEYKELSKAYENKYDQIKTGLQVGELAGLQIASILIPKTPEEAVFKAAVPKLISTYIPSEVFQIQGGMQLFGGKTKEEKLIGGLTFIASSFATAQQIAKERQVDIAGKQKIMVSEEDAIKTFVEKYNKDLGTQIRVSDVEYDPLSKILRVRGDIEAYKLTISPGKISPTFSTWQKELKTFGEESGLFNYNPKPVYMGVSTGGEINIGSKSFIYSPEESSTGYQRSIKSLINQGYTESQAKYRIGYVAPEVKYNIFRAGSKYIVGEPTIIGNKMTILTNYNPLEDSTVETITKIDKNIARGKYEFYHGAPVEATIGTTRTVKEIEENGLIPKRLSRPEDRNLVSLTTNPKIAAQYAKEEGTVFKITLTPEQYNKLKWNPAYPDTAKLQGSIPKNQIEIYKPDTTFENVLVTVKRGKLETGKLGNIPGIYEETLPFGGGTIDIGGVTLTKGGGIKTQIVTKTFEIPKTDLGSITGKGFTSLISPSGEEIINIGKVKSNLKNTITYPYDENKKIIEKIYDVKTVERSLLGEAKTTLGKTLKIEENRVSITSIEPPIIKENINIYSPSSYVKDVTLKGVNKIQYTDINGNSKLLNIIHEGDNSFVVYDGVRIGVDEFKNLDVSKAMKVISENIPSDIAKPITITTNKGVGGPSDKGISSFGIDKIGVTPSAPGSDISIYKGGKVPIEETEGYLYRNGPILQPPTSPSTITPPSISPEMRYAYDKSVESLSSIIKFETPSKSISLLSTFPTMTTSSNILTGVIGGLLLGQESQIQSKYKSVLQIPLLQKNILTDELVTIQSQPPKIKTDYVQGSITQQQLKTELSLINIPTNTLQPIFNFTPNITGERKTPSEAPTTQPVPKLLIEEEIIKKKIFPKKRKEVIKGYQVEVRRRRKFRVESPFALPKEEAITFGIKKTLGSAAATFRLVPTSEEARSLGLQGPSVRQMQYFRAPKTKVPQALTYVQKERQRIITSGEKREITYVGVRAASARKSGVATTFKKTRDNLSLLKTKGRKTRFI